MQAIWSTSADRADIRLHDPIWLAAFRINERKVKDYAAVRSSWRATPRTSIARPAARG